MKFKTENNNGHRNIIVRSFNLFYIGVEFWLDKENYYKETMFHFDVCTDFNIRSLLFLSSMAMFCVIAMLVMLLSIQHHLTVVYFAAYAMWALLILRYSRIFSHFEKRFLE